MAAAKKVADLLKEDAESDAIVKSEFLSILANKHRLHILFLLSKSEYSLSELTRELNETTVALSRHLMILRENKIITGRRFGKMVRYSLTSEQVSRMIATMVDIYSGVDGSACPEPGLGGAESSTASADVKALEALFRNLYPPISEVD